MHDMQFYFPYNFSANGTEAWSMLLRFWRSHSWRFPNGVAWQDIVNSNDDPDTQLVPSPLQDEQEEDPTTVENTANLFQNERPKEPTQTINVWAMTYKYILSKNEKNLNKSFNK